MVKHAEATELDPPQPLDTFHWRRIELMIIDKKQLDERWGCMFYRFVERWRENNKRYDGLYRKAGDDYFNVVTDYRKFQESDPNELPLPLQELAIRRVEKNKRLYIGAMAALNCGPKNHRGYWPHKARRALDELMFDNTWPECERGHKMVRDCIVLLRNYFYGNKARTY